MKHATAHDRQNDVFGIISLGEMGTAIADLLVEAGIQVVSTSAGRSTQTIARCVNAKIGMLPSIAEVVRNANVLISVVPPASAKHIVSEFCDGDPPADAIFMDANSIRPDLARAFADAVALKDRHFVDASINGLARNLRSTATLFLSGREAPQLSPVFAASMRVRVLGTDPGAASAMKMLLSGVSKGVVALLAELQVLAGRMRMTEQFDEALEEIYPEVAALRRRMLPTYSLHARRRQTEMQELMTTARQAGMRAPAIAGANAFHQLVAEYVAAGPGPARTDTSEWLCALVPGQPLNSPGG